MADEYIKKSDAEEYLSQPITMSTCLSVEECKTRRRQQEVDLLLLRSIPAADVQPVRHGRWVDTEPNKRDWDYRKNGMAYYCSCCLHRAGKEKHKTYKYCPWCGAKMKKEMKPDGV